MKLFEFGQGESKSADTDNPMLHQASLIESLPLTSQSIPGKNPPFPWSKFDPFGPPSKRAGPFSCKILCLALIRFPVNKPEFRKALG